MGPFFGWGQRGPFGQNPRFRNRSPFTDERALICLCSAIILLIFGVSATNAVWICSHLSFEYVCAHKLRSMERKSCISPVRLASTSAGCPSSLPPFSALSAQSKGGLFSLMFFIIFSTLSLALTYALRSFCAEAPLLAGLETSAAVFVAFDAFCVFCFSLG